MIDSWAERIAVWIKNNNQESSVSVPVMKFALVIVINFVLPYTIALLIGVATSKFLETLLAVLMLIILRAISGGYHFRSPVVCTIVTAMVASVPPHIVIPNEWNLYFTVLSLVMFLVFAPSNIKGYARMPEKYFPYMKIISSALVASNLFWNYSVLTIVITIQAISLLFTNKKEEVTS